MIDIAKTIASLPPKKRAKLVSKLKEEAGDYGLYSLSYAQERLWFMDQLAPGNANYNMPAYIELKGELDVMALKRAINEMLRRHDILRSAFLMMGESPMQLTMPENEIPLEYIDLSRWDATTRAREVEKLTLAEAQRPFDLAAGYLLRAGLLKINEFEHRLLLTLHHIVADDWSLGIVTREISSLYAAYSQHEPVYLPELPIQYADYVRWQREWLRGDRMRTLLDYWRANLDGAPRMTGFPQDYIRPAIQTFRGSRVDFTLNKHITQALKRLGQEHSATLFMALFAAFNILLFRYTEQTDIVVGTPIANRNRTELEGLIGLFFNTLVLRNDLSGEPSYIEVLARVREVTLAAYANQDLPFVKLVEALHPERDLSHTPLVQVMFILQNAPKHALRLPGLELKYSTTDNQTAQLDMIVSMWESDNGLDGYAHFSTDLYERATVERVLRHFEALLHSIVEHPESRITRLPMVTRDETEKLTRLWNATDVHLSDTECLHQLFENQATAHPDALAAACGTQSLTYGELDARANQWAHHLQALGVTPNSVVGICAEHSLEMLIGMVAILKAGGAYVPLDPKYPRERLSYMLTDASVAILLTQQPLIPKLPETSAQILCLDSDVPRIAQRSQARPVSSVGGQNLAYVIYTSGTTGWPKGVMIHHRGIVNNVLDLNRSFAVSRNDRILALSSSSFDMCVYETFGILATGGAVVIPEPDMSRDPAHWLHLIRQYAVTVWNSAPALLQMLVNHVAQRPDRYPLSLRVVILGGDWVALSLPDQLKSMVPGIRVIVLGGATEASIHSIVYPVEATNPEWVSIPYGRPMANQRAYLLDPDMQPAPVGVAGELYLGGVGLAHGYYARPDLTAEKFLPNPYAREGGERIYRTGDYARFKVDGTIELIGRIDHQVKIRGHRIELGEIERALKDHPAVKQAAVTAVGDMPGEKRLVAYLVFEGPAGCTSNELSNYLRNKLPVYMLPASFVVLDSLPLSPNGKVDRKALPLPASIADCRPEYIAPVTAIQTALVALFTQVTGAQSVGMHDNFFDLGGHSLMATQLASGLRDIFQVEVPLRVFFESPTVAELALAVEALSAVQNIDVQTIAVLYNQLDKLSESEVKAMLEKKIAQPLT